MKQVDKKHYVFSKYSHLDRWASYYNQLQETLALHPESVLEIGVGDQVYGNYLKNNTGVTYTSVDFAEDLKPDVVGDVLNLPFPNASFDITCAFEVLEHLEFAHFEKALSELARVSKKYVLISLPHFGPPVKFLLKIPFLREIKFSFKVRYPRVHTFNGEHYWEIGKKGFEPKKVRQSLEKYFKVTKDFVPFENQYHHFYILEKNA